MDKNKLTILYVAIAGLLVYLISSPKTVSAGTVAGPLSPTSLAGGSFASIGSNLSSAISKLFGGSSSGGALSQLPDLSSLAGPISGDALSNLPDLSSLGGSLALSAATDPSAGALDATPVLDLQSVDTYGAEE